MKLNTESWKAAFRKAAADCKGAGPSDGIVGAVATIRTIRDGLMDDVGAGPEADAIKEGCNELLQQITGKDSPKLAGFASNASSAAAACGLKTASQEANALLE